MSELLSGLNEPQRLAVTTTEGPVLVLAGAGSGKTKALTHRIAYLIKEKKVSPQAILAVTFTNKAAGEMTERIAGLLGFGRKEKTRGLLPWMGTFHSICLRILRREIEALGVSSQFLIFDEDDSLQLIKQAVRDLGIDEKRFTPPAIRAAISGAKNQLIGPPKYTAAAQGMWEEIVGRVYPQYQALLVAHQALDFDDLIMRTVELFLKEPKILEKYQELFAYSNVDEYQDTNHAQYLLVKLLAERRKNVMVVGDDWQSIYGWRGADYQNILRFDRDFPGATVIKLEQNYRSTQTILDTAQAVITKNLDRSDKELWTDKKGGEPVRLYEASSEREEAEFVLSEIERLRREGARLKDVAVLYRTHAQSRVLEELCLNQGLPYRIVGGIRFYLRKEIKDVIAFLRLLVVPEDTTSLRRIINIPARGIGKKGLEKIIAFGTEQSQPPSALLHRSREISGLTEGSRAALEKLGKILEEFRGKTASAAPQELLAELIGRIGYAEYLVSSTTHPEDRLENIEELLSVASRYRTGELPRFLEEIALIQEVDDWDRGAEAVTLMTLHAVKGLEFDTVFMVGMEEGLFPHSRTLTEPLELEEERRLCYVGMTRARERLYLTYATSRLIFGAVRPGFLSRFVGEIPTELLDHGRSLADEEEVSFGTLARGDLIEHSRFGRGEVQSVFGEEAEVLFDEGGLRRLSLVFAPVRKIEP